MISALGLHAHWPECSECHVILSVLEASLASDCFGAIPRDFQLRSVILQPTDLGDKLGF